MAASLRRMLTLPRAVFQNFANKNESYNYNINAKQANVIRVLTTDNGQGNPLKKEENECPEFEISTEDFKYVERLLPMSVVPAPSEDIVYPTPSGWIPQTAKIEDKSYWVRRTKHHMMPVYLEAKANMQKLTIIKKIDGDIFKLNSDLKAYLQKDSKKTILTQVYEVTRVIKVRGNYVRKVADYLLSQGF